jgi:hypothetical protein
MEMMRWYYKMSDRISAVDSIHAETADLVVLDQVPG